jgi:hypothetical protein
MTIKVVTTATVTKIPLTEDSPRPKKLYLTVPLSSAIELSEILKIWQSWMPELQFLEVMNHGWHLAELLRLQEGDQVPIPFIMDHLAVQAHGVVRSDKMTSEGALAARQNDQLLSSRIHVKLGVGFVSTLEMNWSSLGKVDDEAPLLELVDVLLDWHHLKATQALSLLELLHVKRSETGVIEDLGHHSKGVTHEHLIDTMTWEQVGGEELDVVLVISGGDANNVLLHIRH